MCNLSVVQRGLAGGLAIAAMSLPSAALAASAPDVAGGSLPGVGAAIAAQPAGASAPSGFRWGDAGIGAGATVVLLGAGAVASTAARRRRGHRTVIG